MHGKTRRVIRRRLPPGENPLGTNQAQSAGLGAAHDAFFGRFKVVVAGEVQPAVDDVEQEFVGKSGGGRAGAELAEGGVDGDADFAGDAVVGVALEGDHIGDGRVVEERGVKFGEVGIGQENEGELTRRAERNFGIEPPDFRISKFGVEGVDGADQGAAVEAKAGVAVGDGDLAGWGGGHGRERSDQAWATAGLAGSAAG